MSPPAVVSFAVAVAALAAAAAGQGLMDGRPACANAPIVLTDAAREGASFAVPNPYPDDWRCSWLLMASDAARVLVLLPRTFETECGWDYVHVYDGSSNQAPKIAALCGNRTGDVPQDAIVSSSRALFVSFISDASLNGQGMTMDFYDVPCPSACLSAQGICEPRSCRCWRSGGSGDKSFQCMRAAGPWLPARAGHTAITDGRQSDILIFGGFDYIQPARDDLLKYSSNANTWVPVQITSSSHPAGRWGHAASLLNRTMYIFGGTLADGTETNDMWAFGLDSLAWTKVIATSSTWPPAVTGASLTAVGELDTLFLFGGYSSVSGYLSKMFMFTVAKNRWTVVNRGGLIPHQLFGHTAIYHPPTTSIYIHGGFRKGQSVEVVNSDILVLSLSSQRWDVVLRLPDAFTAFHHAVALVGNLIVYSGGLNLGSFSGSQCILNELRVYDPFCKKWSSVTIPSLALPPGVDLRRFGHSLSVVESKLVFVGGYDGRILSDTVQVDINAITGLLTLQNESRACYDQYCNALVSCDTCMASTAVCAYCPVDDTNPRCRSRASGACGRMQEYSQCSYASGCYTPLSCYDCVEYVTAPNTAGCSWCDNYRACVSTESAAALNCKTNYSLFACPRDECQRMTSCSDCLGSSRHGQCDWCPSTSSCDYHGASTCTPSEATFTDLTRCQAPCAYYKTADSCYQSHRCLWCASENMCLNHDAYTTKFPFGQCLSWSTKAAIVLGQAFTYTHLNGLDYIDMDVYIPDATSDITVQVAPTLSVITILFTNPANGRTWTGSSPMLGISASDRYRTVGMYTVRLSNNINQGQSFTIVVQLQPPGTVPTNPPPLTNVTFEPGFDVLYFVTFFFLFLFVFLFAGLVVKKAMDFYRYRRIREEYLRSWQERVIAPVGTVSLLDQESTLMPWAPTGPLKPISLEYASKNTMRVLASTFICILPGQHNVEVDEIDLDAYFPPLAFGTILAREEDYVKPIAPEQATSLQEFNDERGPRQPDNGGEAQSSQQPARQFWRSMRQYLQLHNLDDVDEAIAMEEMTWQDVFENEDDRLL